LESQRNFGQSPYLQETAIYLGQTETFFHSSELLALLSGVSLSDKTIENLCHDYGNELEGISRGQVQVVDNYLVTKKKSSLHYVMVDGSYILSRENAWIETKLGRVFKGEDNFLFSAKRSVIGESSYVAHIGESKDFCPKLVPLLTGLNNLVLVADGVNWF